MQYLEQPLEQVYKKICPKALEINRNRVLKFSVNPQEDRIKKRTEKQYKQKTKYKMTDLSRSILIVTLD